MARLSDAERSKKKAQARELYIREFTTSYIAEVVGTKAETIKGWAKEGGWDDLKKAQNITPSQIQNLILECIHTIKRGEKPSVSPDQLSKLASAYEKLSDKHKHLGYFIDSLAEFRSFIVQKAQEADSKATKEQLLSLAQSITPLSDELIHLKYKELS